MLAHFGSRYRVANNNYSFALLRVMDQSRIDEKQANKRNSSAGKVDKNHEIRSGQVLGAYAGAGRRRVHFATTPPTAAFGLRLAIALADASSATPIAFG